MESVKVRIKKLDTTGDLRLPGYATPGSSGMDVRAFLPDPVDLAPGQRFAVPTGLAVEVPMGYELQVRPRSGLALKYGVTCLNTPGTIDADYRGELKVILANLGAETFRIASGDRIAQLVLCAVAKAKIVLADELSDTDRGEGGFGHTGRH
jgi:dUTP diphosphatase